MHYADKLSVVLTTELGPLLPVIQRDFGVGFAVVSLLFVSNCIVRLPLYICTRSDNF